MRIALLAASFLVWCHSAAAPSGSIALDRALPVRSTDDLLQYDDGSAFWVTWDGTYRGTWFDVEDFMPSPGPDWLADQSELWFYHHTSYPWDTASFYCDVWDGGGSSPVTQLDQTSVMAAHYAPCYANYSPPLDCDVQFWVIINTEMSWRGCPTILADNTPNWTGCSHSFFSYDFVTWEPWIAGDSTENVCIISRDFFIRSESVIGPSESLEPGTWGAIKSLFR